jgi:polysaccharide pyruvyl transferase WcaK-like protein
MEAVSVLDTSIATQNLGDFIIMDSVWKEVKSIFDDSFLTSFPTHEYLTKESRKKINKSGVSIVGGTNLLSSNMDSYKQWKTSLKDLTIKSEIVLTGVGWWQYQEKPNLFTKMFLKQILSNNYMHSVRDSYTQKMLSSIGIKNTLNTGCPTIWRLNSDGLSPTSSTKADSVVFTLTDYKPSPKEDKILFDILIEKYKKIFFWPQGIGDFQYLSSIVGDLGQIEVINPQLASLGTILSSQGSIDYVGTRLHAGIRALQYGKRSIFIEVDNRSKEASKDFNFISLSRDKIQDLASLIDSRIYADYKIPFKSINQWREQFS